MTNLSKKGYFMLDIYIASGLKITTEEANKILRLAYLKGYFNKCEDVQNGCDIHRYIPNKRVVEFHITDPMFWVTLKLEQVIDCQIELIDRERHHKNKRRKRCLVS